jgi:hypothetical protein
MCYFAFLSGVDLKKLACHIAIFIFFAGISSAAGQIPDTRGKEFLFGFPKNYHDTDAAATKFDSLYIFITASEPTGGIIVLKKNRYNNADTIDFKIPDAGGEFVLSLPPNDLENAGSSFGRPGQKYCYIRSDKEVSVYAINRAHKSSDGSCILPEDVLGNEYTVASYYSDEEYFDVGDSGILNPFTPSQFSVLAAEDSTTVELEFSAPVNGLNQNHVTLRMNRGDSYLFVARESTGGLNYDLTGSTVVSDKPLAVFSGHRRALIPRNMSQTIISRDYLFNQLVPVKMLGKNHIVVPFPQPPQTSNLGNDLFRVVASSDNTDLFIDSRYISTLDAGEFYEAELTAAHDVKTNKPVTVVQYKRSESLKSSGVDIYDGDPFMLTVPPTGHFLKEYTIHSLQVEYQLAEYTPDITVFGSRFLIVIVPTLYRHSLVLDGELLSDKSFKEIAGTCYSYTSIPCKEGLHKISGAMPFALYVCAYGKADSYCYSGGRDFLQEEAVLPSCSPDVEICLGDTVQIEAVNCIEVNWTPHYSIAEYDEFVTDVYPSRSVVYFADMVDSIGCPHRDSVVITVNELPEAYAGKDTSICYGSSVNLTATGGRYYQWDYVAGLDRYDKAKVTATPEVPTTYFVTVTDTNGCKGRASLTVDILPLPDAFAGRDTSICPGSSVTLEATGGERYIWDDEPTLSCLDCASPLATPEVKTTYYVTVIDSNMCEARAEVTVDIYPVPDFTVIDDTTFCEGGRALLQARGDYQYAWSPEEFVESPYSTETESKPLTHDTEFTVIATNEFGCTSEKKVLVKTINCSLRCDSVVFVEDIYCFPENLVGEIYNDGESDIRIDSLVLSGEDAESFDFAMGVVLPYDITSGEKLPVDVYFYPGHKSIYSAEIKIFYDNGSELTMLLRANKRKGLAEINISIEHESNLIPGDEVVVFVSLESEHFDKIRPDSIELRLKYNYTSFFLNKDRFTLTDELPADWHYTATKKDFQEDSTTWKIDLAGNQGLSKSTVLFEIPGILMLQSNEVYEIEATGILHNREHCADILPDRDSTRVEFCADTIRTVVLYTDGFTMQTPGEVISEQLSISITVPTAVNGKLSIFDMSGKETILYKGIFEQGKNEIIPNIGDISSGVYILNFSCSTTVISKRILIE